MCMDTTDVPRVVLDSLAAAAYSLLADALSPRESLLTDVIFSSGPIPQSREV